MAQIDSYDWLVGREKGKSCLVAGTAPSIEDFPYARFNGVYLTCGDGPLRLKKLFKPDYWVNANNTFPVPEEHLDVINGFPETVFIFSDSVTYSRRHINPVFLRENLKVQWLAYDQRHFKREPCRDSALTCCELLNLYPGRVTLQEFLQKRFGRADHYSAGATTAIHSLAVAILLGCSPIYLQGIEIPRSAAAYTYKPDLEADREVPAELFSRTLSVIKSPARWLPAVYNVGLRFANRFLPGCNRIGKSLFFDDVPQILTDFQYLTDLANENGIELYNLSKTSTLNEIKNLKTISPGQI